MRSSTRLHLAVAGLPLLVLVHAGAEDQPAPTNLARGAPYALSPDPNYPHSTDPGDATQLTDGLSTAAHFWTQPGTVGWQGARYASITVDLGAVRPIGGAALTTAAGIAGVTWPAAVWVLASDDGSTFRLAGDLVELDRKVRGRPPEGYAIRTLRTDEIAARGRFVRFVIVPVAGGSYIFADEVEVHAGPEALLDREPAGPVAGDLEDLFRSLRVHAALRNRFDADAAALEGAIRAAGLEPGVAEELRRKAAEAARRLDPSLPRPGTPAAEATFRAILPVGDAHAALFRVQAELWRARGLSELSARPAAPWEPLDPFAVPGGGPSPGLDAVEVHAMRGEHRAGAIDIASTLSRPIELTISVEGVPGAPAPADIDLRSVEWTDTARGRPVAAALVEPPRVAAGWRIAVVPGLVRQVWLDVHPRELPPGLHEGRIRIEGDGRVLEVPLRLRVWPLELPARPRLWVGGWSYTNGPGRYGMTPANRAAFVGHLRERFVSAPWATSSALMSFRFGEDLPGGIEIDPSELDAWIDEWPDAHAYLVFLAVGDWAGAKGAGFAEAPIGTPEFRSRVGAWISAWARHLRSRGIAPGRLGLLIHDEPHEGTDLRPFLEWASAIEAAEPEVLIWEDPSYREPWKAPPELFDACDVLCPNRPMWLEGGDEFERFYRGQVERGKTLHLYSCSGPARLLDPYAYYRLQAWQCFREGATGSFFWAFGDTGGASSWNEYLAQAGPFTPLFIDEATVVAGKQMEAIREGIEDHETLCMLRDAVAASRAAQGTSTPATAAALDRAEEVLRTAAADVLGAPGARGIWIQEARDRTVADGVRVRALEALAALEDGAAR